MTLFEMLSYISILESETVNHWGVLVGVSLPLFGLLFAMNVALSRPVKLFIFVGYLILTYFNAVRLNDAYELLFAANAALADSPHLLETLPDGELRSILKSGQDGSRSRLVVLAHALGAVVTAYGLWQSPSTTQTRTAELKQRS